MKPIRILQYIGSLNPGGSQSMIMDLYRKIDKSQIQFDFIIDRKDDGHYVDEIESLGGRVYVFGDYFKGYNYGRFVKQWKKFFRDHPEYDVIHCHVRSVASIVLKIAKKNGLKTICHSHSTSNGHGFKAAIKKYLQSKISKNCDYFYACSKESAKWLYGKKILRSGKCIIMNNAIDTTKYGFNKKIRGKTRKSLGLDKKIVLGQVGRLETVKNYGFSLRILKKLLEDDENYHLVIVGTGPLKKDIINQAKQLGIYANISILENRDDVNDLLRAMDAFVMPSFYEGLPVALVEAQASSLPCIISDTINDGAFSDALVVKKKLNDLDGWCKSIKNINKRNRNSIDGVAIVRRNGFDVRENVKKISDFYLSLSCGRRRKIGFCLGSMNHGGAERVVANLSNSFVKDNDVLIVVTKPGKPDYELDKRIRYFALDNDNEKKSFVRRTIKRVKRLRKILRDESPDVMISFLPEPSFRLMLAKKLLPTKTIISVRNDPNREYDTFVKKMLVRILYTGANGFVFQTPDAKKWFSKKIQSKSLIIPNPIDKSFLCEPYKGVREKKIVTVGRLVEQKNQKLLIDAFSRFYEKHKDFSLEIYGEGLLRKPLQQQIEKLGLNKVAKLMGEVPNTKEVVYKARAFVLASNYEGMPNALMESMALGVPCISTDCPIGGPKFLIKNLENGMLVKVNDLGGMVNAMNVLVDDSHLSKTISFNASRDLAKYSIVNIEKKWEEIINNVLEGSSCQNEYS